MKHENTTTETSPEKKQHHDQPTASVLEDLQKWISNRRRLGVKESEGSNDKQGTDEPFDLMTIPEYLDQQTVARGRPIPVPVQLEFGRWVKSIARSFGVIVPTVEGGDWGPKIGVYSPKLLDTAWESKARPMLLAKYARLELAAAKSETETAELPLEFQPEVTV